MGNFTKGSIALTSSKTNFISVSWLRFPPITIINANNSHTHTNSSCSQPPPGDSFLPTVFELSYILKIHLLYFIHHFYLFSVGHERNYYNYREQLLSSL